MINKNAVLNFDERELKKLAKPYLDSARAGDWKHALRVVEWVKDLGEGRDDLYLLITAGYLHDIGWSGIAPNSKLTLADIRKLEPRANKNSFELIPEVLSKLKFTNQEQDIVFRLVAAADKYQSKKDDEIIIVDADNLSKLCFDHVNEKFTQQDFSIVIKHFEEDLPSRVKSKKAKELLPKLLVDLKSQLKIHEIQ
ncbi:MAG: HD domain-containing protein [Patescibacteria group bacterium]|jgi:hypothetical protein|nr:HD domain-containing protein [Patescibacteria group bacterium]